MYPGEVTRVIATFDLAGQYVWHCHILSHEDHEMMRPFFVQSNGNRQSTAKIDVAEKELSVELKVAPNPFTSRMIVEVNLKTESQVIINIYDSKGSIVRQLYKGKAGAGLKQFIVDGAGWSKGTYFLELIAGDKQITRKLVLQK